MSLISFCVHALRADDINNFERIGDKDGLPKAKVKSYLSLKCRPQKEKKPHAAIISFRIEYTQLSHDKETNEKK